MDADEIEVEFPDRRGLEDVWLEAPEDLASRSAFLLRASAV